MLQTGEVRWAQTQSTGLQHPSSEFVAVNSNYISYFFYNRQCCLNQHRHNQNRSTQDGTLFCLFFYPWWAHLMLTRVLLCCCHSLIITPTSLITLTYLLVPSQSYYYPHSLITLTYLLVPSQSYYYPHSLITLTYLLVPSQSYYYPHSLIITPTVLFVPPQSH